MIAIDDINTIFSASLTHCCQAELTTKKKVLEKISRLMSDHIEHVKYHHVLDALQQRERMGSTSLGHGVAIPHARIKDLPHAYCAVIRLPKAIHFSDEDSETVQLIFGLLVPETYDEGHVRILAYLSDRLRHQAFREQLKQAHSSEELYRALVDYNVDD